ncbi:MAG: SurA N-terminal domain-containing protein, partial [Burkholderiaceae bacterium]|nr:SurA N-terminal domain-containing protein [Burkholderiaceae bacterium]
MMLADLFPRLLSALSVIALIAPASANAAVALPLDRIVAVVNSEAITAGELSQRVQVAGQQLRQQGIQAPPADVLEKQVLERMIIDRAQLQLARDDGIRADEAQ